MRIYLDNCCIQRPLDTKANPRIIVEAEAILTLIELGSSGQVELVASEVLFYEARRTPHTTRRECALELLSNLETYVNLNERIVASAGRFVDQTGMAPLDALHLASAIESNANFFCTCDDQLLKLARKVDTGVTQVVSPLELILEVSK